MASYRKLIPNPLGLGPVTITKEIFSDDDVVDGISKKKLNLALKAKMCEVYIVSDAVEEDIVDGEKLDVQLKCALNNLQVIENQLKESQKESNDKDVIIHDLKLQLVGGYQDMNAETLAKEFTVDELKFIATEEKVEFKATIKEADLATKIVEVRG